MDVSSVGRPSGRPCLILGLGNPGAEYHGTRHNVGFEVVDELARRWRIALEREECGAQVGEREPVILAKPQTYMNRSGHAARCLVERRELAPEEVLVVIDDVSLPLGRLRLRLAGSPGGHRGLESVIENLRSDEVPRLRLGIREGDEAPVGEAMVEFVLGQFAAADRETVDGMVARAADACESWLRDGPEATMNRYNG